MDPTIIGYITFAEELAALAAKAVTDIRGVVQGSNVKDVNTLLDDADATYAQVIAKARAAGVVPPAIPA
jgi:hypothetical protein